MKLWQQKKFRSTAWRIFLVSSIWLAWLLSLQVIQESQLNTSIKTYISQPVQFKLRQRLGKTPPLDDRLRIFGLDDQTIAFLEDDELKVEDFTLLMENIARQKPKAIVLDRLFGKSPKHDQLQNYLQRLKDIPVPIYAGSYFNPQPISYRSVLGIDEELYRPEAYDPDSTYADIPAKIRTMQGYLYGHAPEYSGVFRRIGHIALNDDGMVYPFIRSDQDLLIPHIALLAADSIAFRQGRVYANGNQVPMTTEGTIYINHRPVMDYYQNAKSLRSMIVRARAGEPEHLVREGDVALILFNFYTGSTDFYSGGPFGEIPGGLIVGTAIDSVLQSKWLAAFPYENSLIVLFCLIGLLIGWRAGTISFWFVLITTTTLYFIFSAYMFSYQARVMPWVLPLAGLIGSGLMMYAFKMIGSEIRKVQIEKDYYSEKSLRLEEENKKIKLAEQINLGRAVQEILLPQNMLFQFSAYQIGMRYSPAQEMSGDWLYNWQSEKGERRLFIGDVVGKGPSAAVPVAVIVGILGECERLQMNPEETLGRLNDRLIELFQKQITTTCTMVVINQNQEINFYNAGSPGWFMLKSGEQVYIPMRSSPLGINDSFKPSSYQIKDDSDLVLLTFTDGYLEGSRGLKRLQKALAKQEVDQWNVDRLHQILDEVGAEFRLEDDRSLLMLQRTEQSQLAPKAG